MQRVEVEKVIEIRPWDEKDVVTHQKVPILVHHYYVLNFMVIIDVVVMKLDTIFTF
jgi:hypothetical protein